MAPEPVTVVITRQVRPGREADYEAWLLQQGMVGPAGVLAVTFTNKAAREMLTRLGAMLPLNARAMWIGTFHGLCNRLLRAHHQAAALPATFQILDTQDQLSAIKRLYKVHGIDDVDGVERCLVVGG